jgi:hypothetical protein
MIRIPPTPPSSPAPGGDKKKVEKALSHFELPQIAKPPVKSDQVREHALTHWLKGLKSEELSLQLTDLRAKMLSALGKGEEMMRDPEIEEALKNFAEAYVKNLEENSPYPLDPAYAKQVKEKIYRDAQGFQERMLRGYQVLMDQT